MLKEGIIWGVTTMNVTTQWLELREVLTFLYWNSLYLVIRLFVSTVEPYYTRHHWEPTFCPL